MGKRKHFKFGFLRDEESFNGNGHTFPALENVEIISFSENTTALSELIYACLITAVKNKPRKFRVFNFPHEIETEQTLPPILINYQQ